MKLIGENREKWLASYRRTHFVVGEDGDLVFVPFGTSNLLVRRAYRVPDESMAGRLGETHLRWAFVAIGLVILGVAHPVLATEAGSEFPLSAWLIYMAIGLLAPLILPLVAVLRLCWGLPLAQRAAGDASASHEPARGALLVMGAMLVAAAVGFSNVLRVAEPRLALALAIAATVALLLAILVPVVLRLRRLRVENEQLEAAVASRTEEVEDLNRRFEARLREQVQHIERLGQLKHFFAAPVAEMLFGDQAFNPAKVHRREITAVSIDLCGFTAFSETSEPEEVIEVMRAYHAELGIQVNRWQATLEHFAGDGAMLFFNDPVEVPDHPMRAVELALSLMQAMQPHLAEWKGNGFDIGLGIGIATGYATIGAVGYEGRWEYAAIGTVCNLAARLCSESRNGQVVISKRFLAQLDERVEVEALGERVLKGLSRPVAAFNIVALKQSAAEAPKVAA